MEEFPNFDLGVLREADDSILEICEAVEGGNIRPQGLTSTLYRDGKESCCPPGRFF
jgi:hypothetical protein